MKVADKLHGFKIDSIRELAEIKATLYEFSHLKSGAQLIWLERKEQNKTFSIAFKTIPEDDTGIFHILEHAVLGGSEKYQVKEPFAELLKSSVNTFLNAMTFKDKTMYQVSSRNEKDFFNLVAVYLDAVFSPAVLKDPKIFQQEGWHYAFNEEGEPSYQGVVFNEMKGASSSLGQRAKSEIYRLLFPDSCYRFESGGHPESILDLDYESFKASYARFYHPSNALFFLDGDLPLAKVLEKIDSEYLAHYDKKEMNISIARQEPKAGSASHYYEIGSEEDPEDKCRYSLAAIVCDFADVEKQFAIKILSDVLAGSNEALLKKAVIDSKLAQDFRMYLAGGTAQPWLGLEAHNTSSDDFAAIKKIIDDTLQAVYEQGLDKDDLRASLNQLYFQILDPDEPRGVILAISSLSSWLYGGDPALYLTPGQYFDSLRKKIDSNYYEELLKEILLANDNLVELKSLPSKEFGLEREAREQKRLEEEKKLWSSSYKQELIRANRELESWQNTPDTVEGLKTIPQLSLADLKQDPDYLETLVAEVDGVKIISHPSPAKGIIYLKLYFDISDAELIDLPKINFLTEILDQLPTAKRDTKSLQQEIKTHIGSLSYAFQTASKEENKKNSKLSFQVRLTVLEDEAEYALELVQEILQDSLFDDKERFYAQMLQNREYLRQAVNMSAHSFGSRRVRGHYSIKGAALEAADGISYIVWLKDFLQDFDNNWQEYILWAEDFQKRIFTQKRLTISITGDKDEKLINKIANLFPLGQPSEKEYADFKLNYPKREAVAIPSAVSYACLGCDLSQSGGSFSGKWLALDQILSLEYLWNKIRVQAGAYGAGFSIDREAKCSFFSYRDPLPSNSLKIYQGSGEFIKEFCSGENDIERFIMGKLGSFDPDLSYKIQSDVADQWYFSGYSAQKALIARKELMEAKPEELFLLASTLEEAIQDGAICLIGPQEAIDEEGDLSLIDIS